jgi:DNA-directed RNA polymerase specialized sigma24 family protein
MASRDQTKMGGDRSAFMTTHWSVVLEAGAGDTAHRQNALDYLLGKYWKPVYCYLRRKGYSNDAAKDITQGFFEQIVLGKDLIRRADPQKGRFRTFMLSALDNFLVSCHRSATRSKSELFSLDDLEDHNLAPQSREMQPCEVFTYMWASSLLDGVLTEVRLGCIRDNMQTHWELFHTHVLEPIANASSPPAMRDLCRRFGVSGETKAVNMIVTVKRRFQVAMRQAVRQHVDSESEVDGEIRDLMRILSNERAS